MLQVTNSSTDTHSNTTDFNKIHNPNNNSHRNSQTRDPNFGFKPTGNSKNQLDDENQENQRKPDNWF